MVKDAAYIVITFILVIIGGFLVFERLGMESTPVVEEDVTEEEVVETRASVEGTFEANVDVIQSVLGWQAQKTILTTHVNTGTLNLTSGTLVLEDGVLVGGDFVVDMTSISITSVHGGEPATSGGSNLLKHVSSEDFFDVENSTEAMFVVTDVEKTNDLDFGYSVTGDLTIKDITNEVTFAISLYVEEGVVVAEGSVDLDRTKWDITYGSGSVFDDLGDKVIDDMFNVDILLIADIPEVDLSADVEETEE